MKRWQIAFLALILMILSVSIYMNFSSSIKPKSVLTVVLPTPTIIERKVKIAIMADVHSDEEELRKMLTLAKENQVEMVIVAGDLTINGKKAELEKVKTVLDESGLDYKVIPGNHEYSLENFYNFFGEDYQSVKIDEVKLILINNAYKNGLGEEQIEWIKGEVAECRVLTCLAVMHKPLNNFFSAHLMGEGSEQVTQEAKWLRELLIKSGVRQIEAGHLHYVTSYELEGIRTDIVGAISRERNTQSPRYTELMIGKNLIERRVVEETNDLGN